MLKLLVFDFDGTLANTMPGLIELAGGIIHETYQIDLEQAQQLYRETAGLPFRQQLERICPGRKENSEVVREFEQGKLTRLLNEPLFPDVPAALAELAGMGYINVISSSNLTATILKYLMHHRISIEMVLGFRPPNFTKGEPHFEFLKKHFQLTAAQICYIGDTPEDINYCRGNGTDFIGRVGTFTAAELKKAGASHLVTDFTELPALLDQIAG